MSYLESDPRWSAPDEHASEYEVGDFLYGLVRLTKPRVVIETGTYKGHTTRRIAMALVENGHGLLHTCDISAERLQEAKGNLDDALQQAVFFYRMSGLELVEAVQSVDLAFIDSGNDAERFAECEALNLRAPAFVVLHDSHRAANQRIRRELGWQGIDFQTPRGVTLFCP